MAKTAKATAVQTRASANDVEGIKQSLIDHLQYSVGKDPMLATSRDWFLAAAFAVRDRLIGRWMETQRGYYDHDAKRVYYLSMEFLIGRALTNGMINLGVYDAFKEAVAQLGYDMDELQSWEVEPALVWWTAWRPWACPATAMASAMNSACSLSISSRAGKSKAPRTGCAMATLGNSSAPA